jgi:hypothetical protein
MLHTYWMVVPAFHHEGFFLPWSAVPAFVGIGGQWLAAYLWLLERRPLRPARRRREAAAHAG